MSLINIALSGLRSSQTSLATTGHNISNTNTEGYSRQRTEQETQQPRFTGGGFVGTGTRIVSVDRLSNEFINEELRSAGENLAESEAFLDQVQQLDSLLASSNTSLTSSLERFFGSLSTAAEDPQSTTTRQLVLSEASGLAERFNILYQELNEQNSFVNNQTEAIIEQVNQLANNISGINAAVATSFANGRQPNDLLDSRDQAIRDLSNLVGLSVVEQSNGVVNLFIGTGQPLVVGEQVTELAIRPALDSNFQLDVIQPTSGTVLTSIITGGELGGLLDFQRGLITTSLNELGRLALVTADALNQQQARGLDLDGNFGVNIFNDINTQRSAENRVTASADNLGTARLQVNITETGQLTASDYELRIIGGTYELLRLEDETLVASGATPLPGTLTIAGEGFDIQLNSGAVSDGDIFFISPTRRAADDIQRVLNETSQLAFAAPLRSTISEDNRGEFTISDPRIVSDLDPSNQSILTTASGTFPLTLVFDEAANTFNVTGVAAGFTVTPAAAPFVSGIGNLLTFNITDTGGNSVDFEIDISGRPENADTLTISFNENGVADNRNALAQVALQTSNLIRGTAASTTVSQSLVDSYGQLVENIGVVTSQKSIEVEANQSIFDQSFTNREEISGVNLDEEASNLIRFEQAYNAATQVISVARQLFDRILQI
ncbi:flagellar hook-associated protein FlgK [Sessilibacter sp. MAH4]